MPQEVGDVDNVDEAVGGEEVGGEGDGMLNDILVAGVLVLIVVLLVLFVIRKLWLVCKTWKESSEEQAQLERGGAGRGPGAAPGPVDGFTQETLMEAKQQMAVQNSRNAAVANQRPLCLNCNMIQMGEAVSYADGSCPQCGRDT